MTIRGGGDPPLKPWPPSRCAEWACRPGAPPPMRICIMVPILTDRPNTRLWRGLRTALRAPLGIVISPTQPAAVLTTVKGKSLRDGLRPPLTVARAAANKTVRSGRGDVRRWIKPKDWMTNDEDLTSIAPYKCFWLFCDVAECPPYGRFRVQSGRPPPSKTSPSKPRLIGSTVSSQP